MTDTFDDGMFDWADNDELIEAVQNYDEQKYHEDCKAFDKFYGNLETGTASQQIVDRLETIMG